jgi:hypothetical protein
MYSIRLDNTEFTFPRFFTLFFSSGGIFLLFSRCRDSYTPELTRAFPRYIWLPQ